MSGGANSRETVRANQAAIVQDSRSAHFVIIIVSMACILSALSATAFAGQAGKVVEFGIYSEDHKLLKKTTRIPIRSGIRFGFCFEANIEFFEDRYMLVETLSHPPVSSGGVGEDRGYSVPRMFKVRNGIAYGCSGYRARDLSDLRPGVWKFTISDGDEELVSQEFNIK